MRGICLKVRFNTRLSHNIAQSKINAPNLTQIKKNPFIFYCYSCIYFLVTDHKLPNYNAQIISIIRSPTYTTDKRENNGKRP